MTSEFEEIGLSSVYGGPLSGNNQPAQRNGGPGPTMPFETRPAGTQPVDPPAGPGFNWGRSDVSTKQDGGVTEIDLPESFKLDPAVGWLVCIRGVDKGRSFRLVKGNNTIGRPNTQANKRYAVELTDQQISRSGVAGVIVYNEKNNMFFIMPGDLTSNINPYLNDEILLSVKPLPARSLLEIADDVLMFVPFCCDKFAWRYKPEEKVRGNVSHQDSGETAARETKYESIPPRRFENQPDGPTVIY